MNINEEVITHFYTCFKNKDIKGMQDCYAHNTIFNDAVFSNLMPYRYLACGKC